MCGGPDRNRQSSPIKEDMDHLSIETNESLSTLLELAANNDVEDFKRSIDRDPSSIDDTGLWYCRKKGSHQMVLQHRTPLMVSATYGSLDVLKLILSTLSADVNRACGEDRATALHCAASGASENAAEVARLLISAGADPGSLDADGHRPADIILVSPKLGDVKIALEEILGASVVPGHRFLRISTVASNSSSSHEDDVSPNSDSNSSPRVSNLSILSEKKEYPVDSSLPDIKNSIYSTDEFRMFSFKVRPCSRAYSHDWTECPFVHPGENARRRDPRKFHYSCVPCPDFRKGACRRGDMCEYAHGVFECWLHPAQYRTRLCKDGVGCARRVCFFAHTNEELRPLYMSTGSAMPSPRSSSLIELAANGMGLGPCSPSSLSGAMSPFSSPMSPSGNGGMCWPPPPNVPALHLPGNNLQSSRLRSSLNARDMLVDDLSMMADFESQQLLNDLYFSRLGSPASNRTARPKALTPSNLDELFSAEMSLSPRYGSEQGGVFSPSHKNAVLNQFQQQHQSLLSPINTGMFSPKSMDPQQHSSFLQASLGISSPGRMSPRSGEPVSPMSARLGAIGQREMQQQTSRSFSSRDFGSRASAAIGSPVESSLSKWGSPSGTLEWSMDGQELGRLRRSSSFELRSAGEEPDLSWVHSLVKESPTEKPTASNSNEPSTSVSASATGENSNAQVDGHDTLGAWLDQMQLDQLVA